MYWEVVDVGPGAGENDLVLEVHYWHANVKPARAADLIETVVFENVPTQTAPATNDLGQIVLSDGSVLPAVVLGPDGWGPRRDVFEEPLRSSVVWLAFDPLEDYVVAALRSIAEQVAAERRRGDGRLPEDRIPKERATRPADRARAFARRADVARLRGRSGKV